MILAENVSSLAIIQPAAGFASAQGGFGCLQHLCTRRSTDSRQPHHPSINSEGLRLILHKAVSGIVEAVYDLYNGRRLRHDG